VLQVNGISLHVEDLGSGRPVLLLHGWPDSAYLWRNQIEFLVKNGFRAIAPDLRGLGAPIARKEWPSKPKNAPSSIRTKGS
jgi:pimeloyl-ACP methyl ester carboxylesterase